MKQQNYSRVLNVLFVWAVTWAVTCIHAIYALPSSHMTMLQLKQIPFIVHFFSSLKYWNSSMKLPGK